MQLDPSLVELIEFIQTQDDSANHGMIITIKFKNGFTWEETVPYELIRPHFNYTKITKEDLVKHGIRALFR